MKRLPPGFHFTPCQPSDHAAIAAVWEAAVLATHHFLQPDDFAFYKGIVSGLDFTALGVYVLRHDNEGIIGFLGVNEDKLEMLFLHPDFFGRQVGYAMLQFAVDQLRAKRLDVNEHNTKAVRFYERAGFRTIARREVDDTGRAYPILEMILIRN